MSINSFLHLGIYLFNGKPASSGAGIYYIAQTMSYSRCGIPMHEAKRTDISDGVRWTCRTCKSSKNIQEGSFFAKSRLPLDKWLWACDYPIKDVAQEAEVCR